MVASSVARDNGVRPEYVAKVGSAPYESSSLTISTKPFSAAS